MKIEVKEKWVAALRSGDYPRGKGCLSNAGKFCPLGVLCEVAIKEGLDIHTKQLTPLNGIHSMSYDGEKSFLPWSVSHWCGLSNDSPVVVLIKNGSLIPLTALNDTFDYSFEKIADLIEEQL